jgi:hypothetical protein
MTDQGLEYRAAVLPESCRNGEKPAGKVRNRRTAAARRQGETFLERPVFGIKRPFSNAWGIRGPRGGHISIERRRRDAEAVRDLSHADVGIGEHRLGGLDVVVGEFRRPASGAASMPRGGEARLGARGSGCARIQPTRQTCEKLAAPARSWCRGLRSGCETRYPLPARFRWFRLTASSTAPGDRASTR